ncbi:helix-turn-helix domain-containing protein [Streptomyces lonarensis]|uniref:MerR family transcriptional regulator n=1 Tax=Streptomyces lonarensis TaxID=700599 RepID=A0A7X6D3C1_9ACTN|nr:MerR family transcriptional regulator [Streptomyces lonarensis]NJQ07428.1 MerR family transcriptional regulator [Streptomyces lonarensis]
MTTHWSTRRLAELAGTTVKAIRHYHAVGLLAEPTRGSNGYKRYGTPHLVRLLQIRRLRELGLTVAQIGATGGSGDGFSDAVRTLDAELAAAIERQQAVRAELAELLRHEATADVPPGFEEVAPRFTAADLALVTVSSQLFNEVAVREMREMSMTHRQFDDEFDAVPDDADEAAVRDLAVRLAPVVREIRTTYPSSADMGAYALGERTIAVAVMAQTVADHYTAGQIAVLREVNRILADDPGSEEPAAGGPGPDRSGH